MTLALWAALAIGLSLGLLGSGGSIVTIPTLVYILQRPEKIAIAESLAIVGIVASLGSISYMRRGQVHWQSVLFFGVPGILGACLGGCCTFFIAGTVQLVLFALMMFIVAGVMLMEPSRLNFLSPQGPSSRLMMAEGFIVGTLTGFLGVGGGFLIVPSLVILCHLPMSFAVGTSLVIISMNAIAGFVNQLFILQILNLTVDWEVVAFVAASGFCGSFIGGVIGQYIPPGFLRKCFSISLIGLGSYILFKNFLYT